MFELTWHFSVGFDSLSTERNEMEFNYLICMGSLPKKTIGEFEQILTRMLRLQMTENSPEPRGIRKAKKATWKYSSESNSNISPLLLFHNSRAFHLQGGGDPIDPFTSSCLGWYKKMGTGRSV